MCCKNVFNRCRKNKFNVVLCVMMQWGLRFSEQRWWSEPGVTKLSTTTSEQKNLSSQFLCSVDSDKIVLNLEKKKPRIFFWAPFCITTPCMFYPTWIDSKIHFRPKSYLRTTIKQCLRHRVTYSSTYNFLWCRALILFKCLVSLWTWISQLWKMQTYCLEKSSYLTGPSFSNFWVVITFYFSVNHTFSASTL